MVLSYEAQRLQNIKDNESLLLSLGLVTPTRKQPAPSRPALVKAASNSAKRRVTDSAEDGVSPKAKARRTPKNVTPSAKPDDAGSDASGLRRSTRSIRSTGRKSYKEIDEKDMVTGSPGLRGVYGKPFIVDDSDYDDDDDDEGGGRGLKMRNNKPLGVRMQNPKTFGHIPGVEVGKWWPTSHTGADSSRMGASTDAIHAPFVAGISGNAQDGAWSVALSGGYPDDVDLGTAFTYTGCGGRDLKGTKNAPKNLRTAPQTFDQSFDNPMNAALKRSAETRKPVRVLRGFKLPSIYAPTEGYRYDGLYVVEKAWMAKGLTKGLLVCRYAFKRLPGQGELPVQAADPAAAPTDL